MKTFFPGTRVKVFDHWLYIDDRRTPPSITMKPATVTRWYGMRSKRLGVYSDLIDIHFDHRGESRGHFPHWENIMTEEYTYSMHRMGYHSHYFELRSPDGRFSYRTSAGVNGCGNYTDQYELLKNYRDLVWRYPDATFTVELVEVPR